jgi:3-deoxy-D-manno-octulosonic-acid transferase
VERANGEAPSVPFAWLARLFGWLLAVYVRVVAATAHVSGTLTDGQAVLVFWHEYNLAAVAVMLARRGDLRHVSFSTRGFRGLVITSLLDGVGVRAIPLPDEGADRAEARALTVAMARLADQGYSLVVTPDGPFGPYRAAKPGAAMVARAAGLPILPLAFRLRPALRLRRRWDRQLVPLPFGRIRIVEGEPLSLKRGDALRPQVTALDTELERVSRLADGAER